MPELLEVFTETGAIRRDFSAAEVESLTPERRECFAQLLSSALDCSEAESEMEAAVGEVAVRVREQTAAEEAHRAAFPPSNRIDELRKVMNRPKE
jgi:hypothetical protein